MVKDDDVPTAWRFHQEMLEIFTSIRDLHTNYLLPEPLRSMSAFLPFLVELFVENTERRYLVSHVMRGEAATPFVQGVEVISWNGIPIDRAVEVNADRCAGSNLDARLVRGLERLTVRPLLMAMPPDEDWVIVEYRANDGSRHEARFHWRLTNVGGLATAKTVKKGMVPLDLTLGIDLDVELAGQVKKALFAGQTASGHGTVGDDAGSVTAEIPTVRPELAARILQTSEGRIGYIRIWTFAPRASSTDFVVEFVNEFARLLDTMPRDGLILDIRGNGGGVIMAGECLLQLLSPRRIEPEPAQFISTSINLAICKTVEEGPDFGLEPWVESIAQSVETGSVFSQAFPITDDIQANDIGQRYHGPVVLITDARCYSTTDIFAAGFQDHGIGTVMGVDRNTGAGGANVWTHGLVRQLYTRSMPIGDTTYRPLPGGVDMRVAMRRMLRVGPRAGTPLEDLGVTPDVWQPLTKRDLLEKNAELFAAAAKLLSQHRVRQLDIESLSLADGRLVLQLTTRGIDRIDLYIDEHPAGSTIWSDGTREVDVKLVSSEAQDLLINGFEGKALVAMRRRALRLLPQDGVSLADEKTALDDGLIVGDDDRVSGDHTKPPFNMVCRILAYVPGQQNRAELGTGWIIGSRTVVTAGHVVFNPAVFGNGNRGFADHVEVVPGYNVGAEKPFGIYESQKILVHDQYITTQSKDFDIAVIELSSHLDQQLSRLQFKVLDDRSLRGQKARVTGYDKKINSGRSMMSATATIVGVEPQRLFHLADTRRGTSGAPVWIEGDKQPVVVGIHTEGIDAEPNVLDRMNSATRISSAIAKWIEARMV
jgi:V8-like Glu-specific endopeptidase